jgi:dTDP-4-amino-4,6-dideoxygalactose transaminase
MAASDEGDRERMYARKRLDIGWRDLLHGLGACAFVHDERAQRERVERWFSPRGDAIACLSVRSGLDLFLEAAALPAGSEVLMSALTIPDMWKIIEAHGLVPVPVDVDARTLAPRPEAWAAAATPRTRAVLVAHLFGARIALEPIAKLARERGWILFEDCAQSFTGDAERGDPLADVSMFSFGPIKTATALSGGVLVVRDRAALDRMRVLQATQPVQGRRNYFTRILKYSGLALLSKRPCYALFVRLCRALGKDHDLVIQGSVRGFAGGDFFAKIRHRPNAALLSLLARRLESGDSWRVDGRVARARRLATALPEALAIPAADAPFHSFWVFTVLADDPDRVVAELRDSGFDATRAASLRCVPAPSNRPDAEPREAQRLLARTVYLPAYPEMPDRAIDGAAAALARALRLAPSEREDEVVLTPAPVSPGIFPRPRR